MARVEATIDTFTQWALDTLVIALEVNDDSPPPGRWRRNSGLARAQLAAIQREVKRLDDHTQPFCRQVAIRVIRASAARINDGTPAPEVPG